MWNMQSGIRRKTFLIGPCPADVPNKLRPPTTNLKKKREERNVTGLATDSLNRLVIASTWDATINVSAALWLEFSRY
jgi:U3 small nucleolar RNA-associated protein 21